VMVKLKVCVVRGGILVDVSILSICFYGDGETWCISASEHLIVLLVLVLV